MDLDDIKSNLLALRQLYGLLQNDRDGLSNLNSDGLDYEARVMLKNLLDATTNDVLKAHSEIIARHARVRSLPQPQQLVDTVKQRPLGLSEVSKSSAVSQSCGKEPIVIHSTLSKEKQEHIMPISQTASAQPPKFSFSARESGNKRKFCRICQRPRLERPFMPCGKVESSEKGAAFSTKVMALQEQQNSQFTDTSWDIQQEALQSGSTESTKPKEVLDLHCMSSGAETVAPLSDRPATDLTQSIHNFSGLIRSVADQNHDHVSTDGVIEQLELHISALQMDDENLVLADKRAAEHFKLITNFVPQAQLASPVKKIEGAVINDKLSQTVAVLDDSLQLVITQYSQEPKDPSSSQYPEYTVPSTRISKFSVDQLPKPPDSSSFLSNQLRQQNMVANIFPSEEHHTSEIPDLVEEYQWQIQKENSINDQRIQFTVDQFESLSQLKNQNNCTSRNNPYVNSYPFQQDQHSTETGVAALPAMLVNQNQNQMPSIEKMRRLGNLNAARQMPTAGIFRNNIDTPGLTDYGSKLTLSGTYASRKDSPYSQQAIMRRSTLNHKLRQFTPSQSSYANLDQKPSIHLKNSNDMKRLRRRHLHGQESEVSHSSSPYSSSWTDLQQTSTYTSEKDDSLPRQVRTKMQYSHETSSYGGDELHPRRGSNQTDYTISSSYSSSEGYSSPIGSERAHEMTSTCKSEGERSSSLDPSGSDHLEELSYYSADSSSRRSSPARVYKSANSKQSKKHTGSWKKLKDKLAIVFHHHHHHHHHHHGKEYNGEERKTSLTRQRGKRFHGPYSTSKDETFGEKALEKFGKSSIDKQAGKKQKGDQFHTLARGLMQHIHHSKKSKHSSSRPVDKRQHSNKKVIHKFHWWQLLRHHRGMNKSPAMLGSGNKKGHS